MYDANNRYAISEALKRAVWNKGRVIPTLDPVRFRADANGDLMDWYLYGAIDAKMGWEIDHIRPKSRGGSDDLANLQPLQWENNRAKGDDWPHWNYAH